MATASLVKTLTIEGVSVASSESWTDETSMLTQKALAAGKAGMLSTRTNDTQGIVTVTSHGYTDATTFAVYWSTGVRYGVTASGYTGNTVTITGGDGDNLPSANVAIVLCPETVLDVAFTGNDAYVIWVSSTRAGHVDVKDATPTSLWAVSLTANVAAEWTENSAFTNPVAGDSPITMTVSNGTINSAVLTVGIVKEATA